VHIDLLDHGGPGVYADVRSLTPERADITAHIMLRNDTDAPQKMVAQAAIRDQSGRQVASADAGIVLAARSSQTVPVALTVENPHRWNGRSDPYMYRLSADIRMAGQSMPLLDEQDVPLGLRTIAFDPRRGFLLNGRPYALHGVNYFHPERPGVGTAVSTGQIDEDMAILDDMGATALRLVHFQHPQRVYDDADRLGLPVWTEIPLNGIIDHSAMFRTNVEEQLRELISQNRNHPSVILWGLGNEVYATDPAVVATIQAAQAVAHREDPSRPTVYAHCCQADDDPKAGVSDVIGFNRYFGWYPEQRGTIGAWADGYHARFPDRAFAVSEYGAGGSVRQQQVPPLPVNQPGGEWHPEQAQTAYHIQNWNDLRRRPFVFGTYVWTAFDVASDGRHEGDRPGMNDKGLVTYDRMTKKDAFYWYQANWSDKPMLHLLDRRMNVRDTSTADITVVTNLPAVTLRINDKVIATMPVKDHIGSFRNVPMSMGSNIIAATGISKGMTVMDKMAWVRQPMSSFGVTAVPAPQRPDIVNANPKAPPGQ
jgi:beta-galactosidase